MINTKIAIIVKNDLQNWMKLNVVAFLSSAVAIEYPETHGGKFIDKSGIEYMPFINQPIMIFKAENKENFRKLYHKAKERNVGIGIYTEPLFATKGEQQNLDAIKMLAEEEQDYVGIVLYGDKKQVDKCLKGFKLHD